MERKNKKIKKGKGIFNEAEKDIDDLIDDIAYLDESQNIKKSKSFLDNMYLINKEE
ncbi:hypothetical protein [Flavobacterium cerinum]|uniref:Uncharacterized protein n=1 Tax=Flavobacterium cerinum TaxID=2502784 RepID=A0ABY5IXU6_9FLAO|nr:hypothetical protein [Flavobacterium cerinum]UUC46533.1 hypothetical protein NOX80_04865 [Flavobacterium cerinum]